MDLFFRDITGKLLRARETHGLNSFFDNLASNFSNHEQSPTNSLELLEASIQRIIPRNHTRFNEMIIEILSQNDKSINLKNLRPISAEFLNCSKLTRPKKNKINEHFEQ